MTADIPPLACAGRAVDERLTPVGELCTRRFRGRGWELTAASQLDQARAAGWSVGGAPCVHLVTVTPGSVVPRRDDHLARPLDPWKAHLMKIFGREPALIVGAVGSILTVFAALNMPGLSTAAAAAITSFLSAVLIAWATRPVAPALYTGVISAAVALLAQYGLHVPEGVVAALPAAVLAVFALFGVRPQVTPTT